MHEGNRDAWERTARNGYANNVAEDVQMIRDGRTNLMPAEIRVLEGLLTGDERVIHLQCSHGRDALCIWKLGAGEVVGVDITDAMIESARQKSESLGAPATWIRSDVIDAPSDLDGTADLVYTGKGGICWMMGIDRWAATVCRLLKPGGHLLLFEGHPLDFLWETEEDKFVLQEDVSYFMPGPAPERGFPFEAAQSGEPEREVKLTSRIWTIGQVVTACVQAGLQIELLEEHPEPFWDQFKLIPTGVLHRLPHTFLLLAKKV
ncbi:MAG TPA: class I SAM-dependent methyltransferase [Fimbriimonas sp.]|nr:class I SAM-dependent methyltransferase [Fimbriimonas sp.]